MKRNAFKLSGMAFGLIGLISLSSCKNSGSEDKDAHLEALEPYEEDQNTDNSYPTNATADYLSYVDKGGDLDGDSTQVVHTSQAIDKLAAAVQEKAQELKAVPNDSLQAMVPEEEMQSASMEKDTAISMDSLYTKGQVIVKVLDRLQKDNFPELSEEINELKTSWDKLQSAKKSSFTDAAVSNFFNEAADVLEEMQTDTPNENVEASYVGDSSGDSTAVDTVKVKE